MLQFDAENHVYTLDGKEIISVTQLLKKHNLATDYSSVSSRVLKKAAAKGIVVHEAIQQYIETNIVDEMVTEVHDFYTLMVEHGLSPQYSEQMLSNDVVAGTIDVICADGSLIDIKTAKVLDVTYATWQLSLYKRLREDNGERVGRLYICHLSDNKTELIEVEPISPIEVEKLISAEREDLYYFPAEVELNKKLMSEIESAEEQLAYYVSLADEVKQRRQKLLESLCEEMEENGIKKYETDKIAITYVAPQTRETFDSARFRNEHPEEYKKFVKTSRVKANIRIKLKGE